MASHWPLLAMNNPATGANQVILFTSKQCPHCPAVSKILKQLDQEGKLASLDIFDISKEHALAEKYQVRSVPWFKIADLEFQGLHSSGEISYWSEKAAEEEGILRYLIENLEAGKLMQMESLIKLHPSWLNIALHILADVTAPIQARIGLGAVIEGLANTELLEGVLPTLEKLTQHEDHRVRGDACHYLGFIATAKSKEIIERCLGDEHAEVREIAEESLENF